MPRARKAAGEGGAPEGEAAPEGEGETPAGPGEAAGEAGTDEEGLSRARSSVGRARLDARSARCRARQPRPRYAATRHNAGWMVVDELARRRSGSWRSEVLGAARRDPSSTGDRLALLKPGAAT